MTKAVKYEITIPVTACCEQQFERFMLAVAERVEWLKEQSAFEGLAAICAAKGSPDETAPLHT